MSIYIKERKELTTREVKDVLELLTSVWPPQNGTPDIENMIKGYKSENQNSFHKVLLDYNNEELVGHTDSSGSEEINTKIGMKRAEFDFFLQSMPEDINAHVARGYIDLFAMLYDLGMQVDQILALVDGGRVDSLFQNYNWMNLDYSQELALIQSDLDYHMNCAFVKKIMT